MGIMDIFKPKIVDQDATMSINEVYNKAKIELNKKYAEMKHVNILITGKTGIGKSTLINAVIGKKVAKTGIGRPVTGSSKMHHHTYKGIPMRIYDTVGIELSKKNHEEVKADISRVIENNINSPDTKIHIMWYCISVPGKRYEEFEINWIKHFSTKYNIPVIIVLTQAEKKENAEIMKKSIAKEKIINKDLIIPVLAEDVENKDSDPPSVTRSFGIDILCNETCDLLMEKELKDAFAASQRCIDLKVKRARKWLKVFAAASFGTGFMPLPFSDAPALITNETGMLIKLTTIYGLDIDKSIIASAVSAIIGCSAASYAGKTIVTNLLKFVPGAGTAIGGAISGATAATITTALGEAYIIVLTQIANNEISVKDLKKQFIAQFKKIGKNSPKITVENIDKENKLIGLEHRYK